MLKVNRLQNASLFMIRSEPVTFEYKNLALSFTLLESCSVSDHISEHLGFYELPLLEGLARLLDPDTVVFDVGAHIGNHTIYFAKVLGLRVIAFEPNPVAYEALRRNIEANHISSLVTSYPHALSDQQRGLWMSRGSTNDEGSMSVVSDAGAGSEDGLYVEARRLDDFAKHAGERPVYLKLDVEGHEVNVLTGGSAVLANSQPLITLEVLSMENFERAISCLSKEYVPIGLFNATPTVLFSASIGKGEDWLRIEMARYGVENALYYGQRRNWYMAEARRADKLLKRSQELADQKGILTRQNAALTEARAEAVQRLAATAKRLTTETRLVDALTVRASDVGGMRTSSVDEPATVRTSIGYLRQIGSERDLPQGVRVAVYAFADSGPDPGLLSLFYEVVDWVRVRNENSETQVAIRRFSNGRLISESSYRNPFGSPTTVVADLLLRLDEGMSSDRPLDVALFIAPEIVPAISDLLLDATSCPYVVIAHDPGYDYGRIRPLLGASRAFVRSEGDLDAWNRENVIPAEALTVHEMQQIAVTLDSLVEREPPPEIETADATELRVLLVSYFATPATPVSVQRLRYWHEMLPEVGHHRDLPLDVLWLSATGGAYGIPGASVIRDRGPLFLPEDRRLEYDELGSLNLDQLGASWAHYVEEATSSWSTPFDFILLSGNPFYYFSLARPFRDQWDCKVLLDFRDPFARNPRFVYTVEQRTELMRFEDRVVSEADGIVSVNEECLSSIAPQIEVPRFIVSNGFDERVVDSIEPAHRESTGLTHIAYSGTVFTALPIDDLLDALRAERYRFFHFGRDYSASRAAETHPVAASFGMLPYAEMISRLKTCDAGVIMTSGESSTQTTKLFDYIACDLDIIIVTGGQPRTGNLHEVTRELDGVFWVRNDPQEMRRFFAEYVPTRSERPSRVHFSRRHQAERLLDAMVEVSKQ